MEKTYKRKISEKTIVDIIGHKFGKLLVTEKYERINGHLRRLCMCDCGNEVYIKTAKLRNGHTKSCGCKRLDKWEFGQPVRNAILLRYKIGAKSRNYIWALTDEFFDNLIKQNCYYCGRAPQLKLNKTRKNPDFIHYNGIDRLDNDSGYVVTNVVPCCKLCNRAKNNLSLTEFKNWIRDLCNNQQQ